jgi:ELWxxDGT repeat protein
VRVIEEGPSGFAVVGDVMLFAAKTDAEGRELWRTDGTRGGTRLVRDISPGERSSNPFGVPLGDVFVFAARDGRHGEELWRSDGTRRGTFLLVDIKPHGQNAGDWSFSTATDDGRVFFTADDGRHGEELWVTDGTRRGTHLVRDIDRTPGESTGYHDQPRELTVVGRRVFFAASDGVHGVELWVSDGSRVGTRMVADIDPGPPTSDIRDRPSWLTAAGDRIFFVADDGVHGPELWVSDGTATGTVMSRQIREGRRSSRIEQMAALGDRVVFSATTPIHGKEPWVSDGTPEGTTMLADIAEGDRNSIPYQPVMARGRVFFTAHDADRRAELWSTDGTSTGTRLVKEFPSDTPCGMAPVAAIGGIVFLEGCTLWESDDTERGTIKVGGVPSASREYGVLSDVLLFQNETDAGRGSLWTATPITHVGG